MLFSGRGGEGWGRHFGGSHGKFFWWAVCEGLVLWFDRVRMVGVFFLSVLCRKMAKLTGRILVAFLVLMVHGVSAESEWNTAHATFYGGSDAGGTEGIQSFTLSPKVQSAWKLNKLRAMYA